MSDHGAFRRALAAVIQVFVEAAVTEISKYVDGIVTLTCKEMPCREAKKDAGHLSEAETDNEKYTVSNVCLYSTSWILQRVKV